LNKKLRYKQNTTTILNSEKTDGDGRGERAVTLKATVKSVVDISVDRH